MRPDLAVAWCRVTSRPTPADIAFDDAPVAHVEHTPNTPTIDALVELANAEFARADRGWTAADTLKNVVLTVTAPDGTTSALVVGLPGDRAVDLKRLEAVLHPSVPTPMEEAEFAKHPTLVKGYIGPQVLGESAASGIHYLVDPRVATGTRWITGASEPGRHVFDLVVGRDFIPDGTIEAAEVLEGDPCPICGNPLAQARGIEIGHIFQLGRKFATALDLKVLDRNGKLVTVTMGCYGIGVSRAVAAIAEQHCDATGLVWPRSVSPADVHIVIAGKDEAIAAAGNALAAELDGAGVSVLLDDRTVSPGVKFNDSELIGVPTILVVGKALAEGFVELKDRRSGQRERVAFGDVVAHLVALVRG